MSFGERHQLGYLQDCIHNIPGASHHFNQTREIAWWSYKVNKGDSNYGKRTDTVNDWMDFDSDQNFQIELHFSDCCTGAKKFGERHLIAGDHDMQKNGFKYQVWGASRDSSTWYEKNTQYNNARQLRRVMKRIKVEENENGRPVIDDDCRSHDYDDEESKEEEKQLQFAGAVDQSKENSNVFIEVEGSLQDVTNLEVIVHEYSRNPQNYKCSFEVVTPLEEEKVRLLLSQVEDRCQLVKATLVDRDHSFKILLIGFKCREAREQIRKGLAKIADIVSMPKYWQDTQSISQGKNYLLVKEVPRNKNEFSGIEGEFKKTMKDAVIVKIERIQNRHLWAKYQNTINQVKEKYGSEPQQSYLYHGSNNTMPIVIYQSQEGFDMRFSKDGGKWGYANYFAVKASYSNIYAHQTNIEVEVDGQKKKQKVKQMFYARVMIGRFIEQQANKQLRLPPLIPGAGQSDRFDSVKGFTKEQFVESDVFMVYTNSHAYPEYLITYQ